MRNRIIWGIRIGLLLLAIVFFILLMMREKKQKHAAAASAHTQSLAIRGPGYTTFKVPKKLRTYQTSDVFSSSASNVELTLDSGMFCVLEGETVFLPEVPVYIPSNLTQYWSCTSFSANRLSDHVADLKKNLNVKKLDVKKNDTQKNFSVEMIFNGNARQFAVFIKQLRAWGLTQLDVAQPRGERFFFSGDGETIVNCRFFVFIPEDGGKYILPVK